MAYHIDQASANRLLPLVTFTWGAANVARYCGGTRDLVVGGSTYAVAPELEVDLGRQDGGVKDCPIKVVIPATLPPADTLCRIYAHANVRCVVRAYDPDDGSNVRDCWGGDVIAATKNPGGKTGLARLDVGGPRYLLDASLGLCCTSECSWNFTDKSCGILKSAVKEDRTVVSVSDFEIEVFGLSHGAIPGYYRNGWVEYDRLRIKVRDQISATQFTMTQRPPPEWAGQTAEVVPGCDKTEDECNTKWNNGQRRVALGAKMLNYDPRYESP